MHPSPLGAEVGAEAIASILGALSACGPQEGQSAQVLDEGPDFDFMMEVMQPAADVVWGSAGWVIDAEGEHNLAPTTDEGWAESRQGALDVIAAGEALKTADFAYDQENWVAFADGIIAAGGLARDAADAQDDEAMFEAGAQLYRVCLACHQFYRVGEFEPIE